ncbi:hypothetical protein BDY19DRAFT_918422 [Irpex rosettiformis]|uniref:Uncharacterized protein n=1 Tax=Irpex rosettiformis TaxID=378272 RepID=A0ACB8UH92_9APHY|nr:hypothetical protein BDY19DRAFT_918422 [Irpex rosettiformis]
MYPRKEKPSVESKRYFSPTPDDLRALVFDYLCYGSYTKTARAFMRDSLVQRTDIDEDESMDVDDGATESPIDLASEDRLRLAQLRKEIKIQILSGKVDEAITLLNTYFPAVLAQEHPAHPISSASPDTFAYIAPRSIDPTHLLLDLRILGFIEAARTVSLPYHPPGSSTLLTPSPSHTFPKPPKSSYARDDSEPSEQQQLLLHKAQKLYSDAGCLPKPEDRALYLKELGNVSALLAYTVPEESTLAAYLDQARREEMADQIEGAILYHTGELAVSKIELGVRYTSVMWDWLNNDSVSLPPLAKRPPGVQRFLSCLPFNNKSNEPSASTTVDHTSSGKKSPEKDGELRVPPFDLTDFLDAKLR